MCFDHDDSQSWTPTVVHLAGLGIAIVLDAGTRPTIKTVESRSVFGRNEDNGR